VDEQWTLPELVSEAATRIKALPAPKNGQVRAVPDDRTIRYYGTIGLLDRPLAMRGRTALYGRRHLAQVVAIKRLQTMGRSLAEIQTLWPTLDETSLARMSGVALPVVPAKKKPAARADFWKHEPIESDEPVVAPAPAPAPAPAGDTIVPLPPALMPAPPAPVELRVELAPNVLLTLVVVDDRVSIHPADVRAIRAAAAPLVAELARRQLCAQSEEGDNV
jgi:DNA-binding transcriptional MerR regulator